MNIFNNIKGPEYYAAQSKAAYLQRRGITEEEYQKEHQEDLNRLGITEEEYQKRERRKAKFKAIIENWCAPAVGLSIVILGGSIVLLLCGIISVIKINTDPADVLGSILMESFIMFLVGSVFVIVFPIYLLILDFLKVFNWSIYIKIYLIITLLIVVTIGIYFGIDFVKYLFQGGERYYIGLGSWA